MSPLSRRAFLGSVAAIPAAAFMLREPLRFDGEISGWAPIGDDVLAMSDGKLYRICRVQYSPSSPTVWVQAWVEVIDA